jgi:hypothetical protein
MLVHPARARKRILAITAMEIGDPSSPAAFR